MKVIVRHAKHKSVGTIAAAASHTMRRRPTPNADPAKPAPEVWAGSGNPADDVRRMLPDKRRKNAVLALEYVLTASPQYFAAAAESQWRSYLRKLLEMLQGYYRAEHVVSAVLHLDEKTPHLSVMVVPLVDGRLNARALVGTREACTKIQDLAGEVGKAFGLERGQRGSRARHQEVRRFYADIEPAMQRANKAAEDARARVDAVSERENAAGRLKIKLQDAVAAVTAERERLQRLAASLSPVEEARAAAKFAQRAAETAAKSAPSSAPAARYQSRSRPSP